MENMHSTIFESGLDQETLRSLQDLFVQLFKSNPDKFSATAITLSQLSGSRKYKLLDVVTPDAWIVVVNGSYLIEEFNLDFPELDKIDFFYSYSFIENKGIREFGENGLIKKLNGVKALGDDSHLVRAILEDSRIAENEIHLLNLMRNLGLADYNEEFLNRTVSYFGQVLTEITGKEIVFNSQKIESVIELEGDIQPNYALIHPEPESIATENEFFRLIHEAVKNRFVVLPYTMFNLAVKKSEIKNIDRWLQVFKKNVESVYPQLLDVYLEYGSLKIIYSNAIGYGRFNRPSTDPEIQSFTAKYLFESGIYNQPGEEFTIEDKEYKKLEFGFRGATIKITELVNLEGSGFIRKLRQNYNMVLVYLELSGDGIQTLSSPILMTEHTYNWLGKVAKNRGVAAFFKNLNSQIAGYLKVKGLLEA